MDLSRQRDLESSFQTWFSGGYKAIIEDNRRRYRMEVADAKERDSRKLSVIPSVKSTTVVDNAVDRAFQEYHQDPEAISYTALSRGNAEMDAKCRWLTEIVRYRMRNTFKFSLWHLKSLKAGFADGMEAALVSWKYKKKQKKVTNFFYTPPEGNQKPVTEAEYKEFNALIPGYEKVTNTVEVVVQDTWWIDQLMPGRDLVWDPKAPLFDIDLGQFALVKRRMSVAEVKDYIAAGIFDATSEDKLKQYQGTSADQADDQKPVVINPATIDFGEYNLLEIWMFFDRAGNDWGVQFSIEGTEALSSRKPVNDVFFGGREENCLPIAMGCCDLELWENIGRGLPKIIAPLEDEATDHRNNYNDYAKQLLRGKRWVSPDSDIDVDQLIHMPVVYGRYGTDFGDVPVSTNSLEVLRATDNIEQDMNALIPVDIMGMGGRVTPKGMEATLGNVQMTQGQSDAKLGIRLLTRNITFFNKVLTLIAKLTFAYETDETIARLAASKVTIQPMPNGPVGATPLPYSPPMDGSRVDFRQLDFDFTVQVNAGLGAVPIREKAMSLFQILEARTKYGYATDLDSIFKQLNVLAGYEADAFTPTTPPAPQQKVEYKATVKIEMALLPPDVQQRLLDLMMTGQMDVTMDAQSKAPNAEARQNGGGMFVPNRTGQIVDATGDAALRMSRGGMNSA